MGGMVVSMPPSLVSVQMESGVVQLVVEQVCAAMATVSHNSHVTTWACKVFSHAASNSEYS